MAEIKIPLADLKKVVYNGSEATTVNFGVCTWTKPYTLTLPALPAGVASCTVSRTSTKSSIGTTGTIATAGSTAKTVTVYHGDTITISATAATGYNNPSATLSQTTVSGNITATITAGSVKTFTLTIPALPTGVASLSITRTPKLAGAAATQTFSATSSSQSKTIYYGDTLTISATAASGYNAPTYSLSATTVTGNVTATVTAGSVSAQWRTILSKSTTYNNGTTTLSGLKANVPTKITFKGGIVGYVEGGDDCAYEQVSPYTVTATINQRTDAESDTGVYTGSGSGDYGSFGFTLTMQNNAVNLTAYFSGDFYDYNGFYCVTSFQSAYVTITKIEQYY